MTEHPVLGAMLTWLLQHRELSSQELADHAGVPAAELGAVLAGTTPSEGLLRHLAPALGLHAVDLFILAGLTVPDDLAPLDDTAQRWVAHFVIDAVHLPKAGRSELLRLVRSLPQEERGSAFAPRLLAPIDGGPGAHVIRMLQYRNLNWPGMAKTLAILTPTYLSSPTYGVIGAGRKELTPRLITDFAGVLGFDARELAGLTGVPLPEAPPPPAPEVRGAAELLWEARRLSAAQVRNLAELARSMRGGSRNGYVINLPTS